MGYRVKSHLATRLLLEYIVKGFVLDDERLKNPDRPFDYFDELLRRIQDIRTSERRFYQKSMTAAEIIHERSDSEKANMGLTNWRGAKVRKQDVSIAKNDLAEPELLALNNLVEQYLVFAEGQAMGRFPMHMADWIKKLDAFLSVNDREILKHAGRISHEMAKEFAEDEYEKFNLQRIRENDRLENYFDKAVKQLTNGKRKKKA